MGQDNLVAVQMNTPGDTKLLNLALKLVADGRTNGGDRHEKENCHSKTEEKSVGMGERESTGLIYLSSQHDAPS